jgi:hypothetical protein
MERYMFCSRVGSRSLPVAASVYISGWACHVWSGVDINTLYVSRFQIRWRCSKVDVNEFCYTEINANLHENSALWFVSHELFLGHSSTPVHRWRKSSGIRCLFPAKPLEVGEEADVHVPLHFLRQRRQHLRHPSISHLSNQEHGLRWREL